MYLRCGTICCLFEILSKSTNACETGWRLVVCMERTGSLGHVSVDGTQWKSNRAYASLWKLLPNMVGEFSDDEDIENFQFKLLENNMPSPSTSIKTSNYVYRLPRKLPST